MEPAFLYLRLSSRLEHPFLCDALRTRTDVARGAGPGGRRGSGDASIPAAIDCSVFLPDRVLQRARTRGFASVINSGAVPSRISRKLRLTGVLLAVVGIGWFTWHRSRTQQSSASLQRYSNVGAEVAPCAAG